MPRIGRNPLKKESRCQKYKKITCIVLTYSPILSGYFKENKDIIEITLLSIKKNTSIPIDIILFDNGSCKEYTDHLVKLKKTGVIDVLILSAHNYGKIGALNFLVGASQGEYIMYTDGDVYFAPGWLEEHLKIFETFQKAGLKVGMVTGRPWPTCNPDEMLHHLSTTKNNHIKIKPYKIPKEIIEEHIHDLGSDPRKDYTKDTEIWHYNKGKIIEYEDVKAYLCAMHMQFLMPSQLAKEIFPLPATRPLYKHDDRQIDKSVIEKGYIKLSPLSPCIKHIGNSLDNKMKNELQRLRSIPFAKKRDGLGWKFYMNGIVKYWTKRIKRRYNKIW